MPARLPLEAKTFSFANELVIDKASNYVSNNSKIPCIQTRKKTATHSISLKMSK